LSKEGTNLAYFAPIKTPILTKSSLKLTLSEYMRYNIMWLSLSVTCDRSVTFSVFLHQ